MLYPEINKLKTEAGSRYYLVSMAAKRSRDLIAGWDPERGYRKLDSSIETNKPVSIAAEEIARGLFTYIPAEQLAEEEEALGEAETAAAEDAEEYTGEADGEAAEEEPAETAEESPAQEE